MPNTAGATGGLCVADDLTYKRFKKDGSINTAFAEMLRFLKDKGHEIGGHTGSHVSEVKCDCGALDRMAEIYEYIAKNAEDIRDLAFRLGVEIDDETHDLLQSNAAARNDFSTGKQLFKTLKDSEPSPELVDELEHNHNEVLVVVNMRKGTTLDRDALLDEFRENYEAFNVDVWAFEDAARVIAEKEEDIPALVTAILYFNLATALVLGGKKLRIVVLGPDTPEDL